MHDLCGQKRTINLNTVWVCTLPEGHAGPHQDGPGSRFTKKIFWTTEHERALIRDMFLWRIRNPDEFLPIEFDYNKETGVKTKLRRFYVAHPKIQDNHNTWAKSTLQEAIDHATELVEKTGQTQYIVKIIKVVSRAKPPIKVEDAR